LNSDIEAEPKTAGEIEADAETARAAQNPDIGAKKLLDRRARRKAGLAKFKEKQKRQLRWVPLRSPIDWLKEFNERGERCAPNERLAEIRTDEIWGALTGSDILFAKYQLGNNGFAHCLIEDDANPKGVSRFTADDIAGASKDPQMISALIDRLWAPRELLLKLFQEKQWPIAPWLENTDDGKKNECSTLVLDSAGKTKPRIASAERQALFQEWRNACGDHIPSEPEDCVAMLKHGIRRAAVRKLRSRFPTKPRGKPKKPQEVAS
jgi:hypothetical protein